MHRKEHYPPQNFYYQRHICHIKSSALVISAINAICLRNICQFWLGLTEEARKEMNRNSDKNVYTFQNKHATHAIKENNKQSHEHICDIELDRWVKLK